MQLSYRNIMRLGAPKLKEAIFYSCQLIIEGGPTYSSTSEGRGGERDGGDGGMDGSGFEVRGVLGEEVDEELRGELFYILNVFFFPTQSLSLWYFSLVTSAALKSKPFIHHVPLNILKSSM